MAGLKIRNRLVGAEIRRLNNIFKDIDADKMKIVSGLIRQAQPVPLSKLAKVLLQRRTAGCGGKTVTVVSLPKECPLNLEAQAKDMRKALGCGSRAEEGKIILQGDICDRAEDWFIKNGVKKVVKG